VQAAGSSGKFASILRTRSARLPLPNQFRGVPTQKHLFLPSTGSANRSFSERRICRPNARSTSEAIRRSQRGRPDRLSVSDSRRFRIFGEHRTHQGNARSPLTPELAIADRDVSPADDACPPWLEFSLSAAAPPIARRIMRGVFVEPFAGLRSVPWPRGFAFEQGALRIPDSRLDMWMAERGLGHIDPGPPARDRFALARKPR